MGLNRYKLIIFDADGTLRQCTIPGQPCPNQDGEWKLLPNVKSVMRDLTQRGTFLGIASNQRGVSLGYLSADMAYDLLVDCFVEATGCWPKSGAILLCTHGSEEECKYRKPKPGMLNCIMDHWDIKPEETLFVGDMDSDREAAENAGTDFMWAKDFFGWDD